MRPFILTCLGCLMIFQMGCSIAPKLTLSSKRSSNAKVASQFLAARQKEELGKFEEARVIYDQLLAKQPKNHVYMHRLAVVCTRLQRYGEADQLYEKARQHDPRNATLLSDMGYSHYLRGDLVQAEQRLREAIHFKPSEKKAHSNLALVVGVQGRIDESRSLLKGIGNDAEVLAGLGYIYSQRGENDLAEQNYRSALAVNPNFKEAIAAVAELSKRRESQLQLADKSKLGQANINGFVESMKTADDQTSIVQVSATKEISKSVVMNAQYLGDSNDSSEPALLVADHDLTGRVVIGGESPTKPEMIDDDAPSAPTITESLIEEAEDVDAIEEDTWDSDLKITPDSLLKKGDRHLASQQRIGGLRFSTEPAPVFQQAAEVAHPMITNTINDKVKNNEAPNNVDSSILVKQSTDTEPSWFENGENTGSNPGSNRNRLTFRRRHVLTTDTGLSTPVETEFDCPTTNPSVPDDSDESE